MKRFCLRQWQKLFSTWSNTVCCFSFEGNREDRSFTLSLRLRMMEIKVFGDRSDNQPSLKSDQIRRSLMDLLPWTLHRGSCFLLREISNWSWLLSCCPTEQSKTDCFQSFFHFSTWPLRVNLTWADFFEAKLLHFGCPSLSFLVISVSVTL